MKIFLDTADRTAIKKWMETGIIDGVTTNPTHLSKEGGDPKKVVLDICDMMEEWCDVSVEVTQTEPEEVYKQALEIAALADNVVVKIPCHLKYYDVIARLVQADINVNVTLVFTVAQALMMCKLGVAYISPFVGRLDDSGVDGIQVLTEIRLMMDTNAFIETDLLAASLRNEQHFYKAMMIGVDAVTVPVEVLQKVTTHPLTDQGMEKFLADWQKLGVRKFP